MRIDWARLGILLRDGREGGGRGGVHIRWDWWKFEDSSRECEVHLYHKYSLNFEMVEWAPPSLQECTGVRGGEGGWRGSFPSRRTGEVRKFK